MDRVRLVAASVAVAGLAAVGAVSFLHRPPQSGWEASVPLAPSAARPQDVRAFMERHAADPRPAVQDQVARARIASAYKLAERKEFRAARQTLLSAAREYRGTGAAHPDYGSLSDQARYQAAVCLAAEGRKDEARREFVALIERNPLSPVVHAAFGRLRRLDGGQVRPEYQRLLEDALLKQNKRVRFEASVCGPKALAYVLPTLGKRPVPYERIAKLAGTTDDGTTVSGLRQAAKALGMSTFAYRLDRQDLRNAPLPALWLQGGHFVALLRWEGESALVYDPLSGRETRQPLPPASDLDFVADVISFAPATLAESL